MWMSTLFKKPTTHSKSLDVDGRRLIVEWTDAAEQALSGRQTPLIVEMQLFFSCTIQKLVYFHDQFESDNLITVDDRLKVCFQPVKASVCDPVEFARSHPADSVFQSEAAKKMSSKHLTIDWFNGAWQGKYSLLP